MPDHTSLPGHASWHYVTEQKAIGVDDQGHDVEYSKKTGKTKRIYSLNQQREAVAYARKFGAVKASKKYDIPSATIRNWTGRAK